MGDVVTAPADVVVATSKEVLATAGDVAGTAIDTTRDVIDTTLDGDLGGAVGAAVEGTVQVGAAMVEGAADTVAPTIELVGDAGEKIGRGAEALNDEVVAPVIEAAGDLVVDPAVRAMTRCHARAEREPDPERRQALVDECNSKKTGEILGVVGTAIGAPFGPAGAALGGAAGSIVGSMIDGSPNVAVRIIVDTPDTGPPDAERRQPRRDAPDVSAPSASPPDRRLAAKLPSLPSPWAVFRKAWEPTKLNEGEEAEVRKQWEVQRRYEFAKLQAAMRDLKASAAELENDMRSLLRLAGDLCSGESCAPICAADPDGRACSKSGQ